MRTKAISSAVCILCLSGVSACAIVNTEPTIKPSSEAGQPIRYSYTDPEKSGLKPDRPFPTAADVCVVLQSNALTEPFEAETHLLIACPKHEMGAIEDRINQQKATVVGNSRHWVVMSVPLE